MELSCSCGTRKGKRWRKATWRQCVCLVCPFVPFGGFFFPLPTIEHSSSFLPLVFFLSWVGHGGFIDIVPAEGQVGTSFLFDRGFFFSFLFSLLPRITQWTLQTKDVFKKKRARETIAALNENSPAKGTVQEEGFRIWFLFLFLFLFLFFFFPVEF